MVCWEHPPFTSPWTLADVSHADCWKQDCAQKILSTHSLKPSKRPKPSQGSELTQKPRASRLQQQQENTTQSTSHRQIGKSFSCCHLQLGMWQEAGLRARGRQGKERLNSSVYHSSSQPRLLQQLPGSCCHLLMRGRPARGSTGGMEITSWHRSDTHPRDWNGRLSPHSKNLLPQKRSKA